MKKPFFSIITCTLNSEKFIGDNLKSVSVQSCKNWEHVFIDGESKDGTVGLIKKHLGRHPEKVVLIKRKPKGIANAMNEGIKAAKGKYVFMLNSDDYFFDTDVLSGIEKFLMDNNYPDWIYGKIRTVDYRGREIGYFPRHKILQSSNLYLLKFINYVPHQATFVKRDVFNKNGYFDENLEIAMDPEYWLRISKNTKLIFADIVVANYRLHSGAKSSSLKNKDKNKIILMEVKKKYLNSVELIIYRFLDKFLLEPRAVKIYR